MGSSDLKPKIRLVSEITESSAQALVGQTVGDRYLIQQRLDERGLYLGEQTEIRRPVMVRVLSRALTDEARFQGVLGTLSKLNHPSLLTILDHGKTNDGDFYAVCEYVKGTSLEELLQDEAPVTFTRALRIGLRIARILTKLHRHGVIHGGLSLSKVLAAARR